jgi:hypothetical protein
MASACRSLTDLQPLRRRRHALLTESRPSFAPFSDPMLCSAPEIRPRPPALPARTAPSSAPPGTRHPKAFRISPLALSRASESPPTAGACTGPANGRPFERSKQQSRRRRRSVPHRNDSGIVGHRSSRCSSGLEERKPRKAIGRLRGSSTPPVARRSVPCREQPEVMTPKGAANPANRPRH